MATCKAAMRPALEYASSYGCLLHPRTALTNAALRTATGCKQKTQHPSHPLHKHTTYFNTPRLKTHYL